MKNHLSKLAYLSGTIRYDLCGLRSTLHFREGTESTLAIEWSEVVEVVVFKRDVFAYDLICMSIRTPALACVLDEQMDGWEALIDALPDILPGAVEKGVWWERVAFPPFAVSPTILFKRNESEQVEGIGPR